MPLAPVNGIDLYYEQHGSGFPLVWSHEFAGDYRSWKPQVQFFSRRYTVITYNARGYPPSSVPDSIDDYTQENSVDDLKGLLDYLGIEIRPHWRSVDGRERGPQLRPDLSRDGKVACSRRHGCRVD